MKFKTNFNNRPDKVVSVISAYDPAVPDLSFTIRELQEKFTLQTQVVMEQLAGGKKLRYEFKDAESLSEGDLEAAFDSPTVQTIRGYDLVDIAAIADSVARVPSRLAYIKKLREEIARRNSAPTSESKDGTSAEG